MLVATAIAYALFRIAHGFAVYPGTLDLGFLALETVFVVTSRDCLRKYYRRANQVLSQNNARSE